MVGSESHNNFGNIYNFEFKFEFVLSIPIGTFVHYDRTTYVQLVPYFYIILLTTYSRFLYQFKCDGL